MKSGSWGPILIGFLAFSLALNIFLAYFYTTSQQKAAYEEKLLAVADRDIGDLLKLAGIGRLESTHIHADLALIINGDKIDFSQPEYQVQSPYVHFEEGRGDVVHVHAKGITLSQLFNTLGIRLTQNCVTVSDTEICNNGGSRLRYFVNGVENAQGPGYVISDMDWILITYGNEDNEGTDALLASVTHNAHEVSGMSDADMPK